MLFILTPVIHNGISPATNPGCRIVKSRFRMNNDNIYGFNFVRLADYALLLCVRFLLFLLINCSRSKMTAIKSKIGAVMIPGVYPFCIIVQIGCPIPLINSSIIQNQINKFA